jgi:hypothetical protein
MRSGDFRIRSGASAIGTGTSAIRSGVLGIGSGVSGIRIEGFGIGSGASRIGNGAFRIGSGTSRIGSETSGIEPETSTNVRNELPPPRALPNCTSYRTASFSPPSPRRPGQNRNLAHNFNPAPSATLPLVTAPKEAQDPNLRGGPSPAHLRTSAPAPPPLGERPAGSTRRCFFRPHPASQASKQTLHGPVKPRSHPPASPPPHGTSTGGGRALGTKGGGGEGTKTYRESL